MRPQSWEKWLIGEEAILGYWERLWAAAIHGDAAVEMIRAVT